MLSKVTLCRSPFLPFVVSTLSTSHVIPSIVAPQPDRVTLRLGTMRQSARARSYSKVSRPRLAPPGFLIVPFGLDAVVGIAAGAGEAPCPAIAAGDDKCRDRLAAGRGLAADRHEDELAVLPRRHRVVAAAQILHEGHVALAVLVERGDCLA